VRQTVDDAEHVAPRSDTRRRLTPNPKNRLTIPRAV